MEDGRKERMDIDPSPGTSGDLENRSDESSTQATKSLPGAYSNLGEQQGPPRATSVDMADDLGSSVMNGVSAASSDTASVSNQESTATSVSTMSCAQTSPPTSGFVTGYTSEGEVAGPSLLPSVDDQVAKVMALHARPLVERQEGYLLSTSWLARVLARTSDNIKHPGQFDKTALEGEIGPVDNSDLVAEGMLPLKLIILLHVLILTYHRVCR
jgi:ubiquitin carboxyl-terminal hydrolase 4/11/15